MDHIALAELLYPNVTMTPEELEARYPARNLPDGAKVTRFAPSPTGYVHFGGLYQCVTDERLAHRSGGVFLLRIEDTDAKREIKDGVSGIINSLSRIGISFDEGATLDGDKGDYGPYVQSQRTDIYRVYAKKLVSEGKAYPCFCTQDELAAIRTEQEQQKCDPGYYGKWAVWRDAPIDRVRDALTKGLPFVLRYRSEGNVNNKFKFNDLIKGEVEITENDKDHVIMKSDGTPPYAFAHAVDDHLMRTTHVVRGEEWLPSLPFHIQLFKALGFKLPKYCHTALILKLDNGNKRKLSKRKDPEAAVDYYVSSGFYPKALLDYVMTLLNSNFEEWRTANPDRPLEEFDFSTKKMSVSGSLFDIDKLIDICKNVVSRLSADEVYDLVVDWAREFDEELFKIFESNRDYAVRVLSIGRNGKKPRKDFALWSEVKNYVSFFYDDLFTVSDSIPDTFDKNDVKKILSDFASSFDESDTQDQWFSKIKEIASANGFCSDMKQYKQSPESFKGSVADVSMFLRVSVTGRLNSPDLYEVMSILGADRVKARLETMRNSL